MTDYSRDRLGPDDEDRLPWLEPVEEEPEEEGVGSGRLIAMIVIALVVIGVIVGGFFWMRSHESARSGGGGALIKAPDSYYKERPAEQAAGTDDEIVYSASKGNEVDSVIDTSGTAETPVNVDRPQPAAAPTVAAAPVPAPIAAKTPPPAPAKPAAKPTVDQGLAKQATKEVSKPAPAKATPAPVTASGGSTIQIGAFSSQAKANAAWKNLSGRFSFLAGLTQSVVPVESGDKTLYRLRATGGNAGDICSRLRTAGESCSVVG